MHYYGLVLVKGCQLSNVEEKVEKIMENHAECSKCHRPGDFDWFQIGGRFSGKLDGYDPTKDPRNIDDKGKVRWPTEWLKHSGNIQLINDLHLTDGQIPHTVITDEDWWEKEYDCWCESKTPPAECTHKEQKIEWKKEVLTALEDYPGGFAVVVDYRN